MNLGGVHFRSSAEVVECFKTGKVIVLDVNEIKHGSRMNKTKNRANVESACGQ